MTNDAEAYMATDGGRLTHLEIVCPWCGHPHRDSWDFGDAHLIECVSCNRLIAVEREVVVWYTTSRFHAPDGEGVKGG